MCNNVAPIGVPFLEIDTTKGPCKIFRNVNINVLILHTKIIKVYTVLDRFVDYVSNIPV